MYPYKSRRVQPTSIAQPYTLLTFHRTACQSHISHLHQTPTVMETTTTHHRTPKRVIELERLPCSGQRPQNRKGFVELTCCERWMTVRLMHSRNWSTVLGVTMAFFFEKKIRIVYRNEVCVISEVKEWEVAFWDVCFKSFLVSPDIDHFNWLWLFVPYLYSL